jgi:hypothetical protein
MLQTIQNLIEILMEVIVANQQCILTFIFFIGVATPSFYRYGYL